MYCTQCGTEAVLDAGFCGKCGAVLSVTTSTVEEFSQVPVKPNVTSREGKTRPWVRYWARSFDYYLFSVPWLFLVSIGQEPGLSSGNSLVSAMIIVFLWMFIEAWLLSYYGTTPGKWLFRTRLSHPYGRQITYLQALVRSMKIWMRGLGIGIPIVSLITLIVAYTRIERRGVTSWDHEGDFAISHGRIGVPRTIFIMVLFFIMLLLVVVASTPNA